MAEKSSLGRRVRALRLALGLSQEDLGLRLDVDRSYISRIENGHTKMPSMGILSSLAHALGVKTDDLLSAAGHATTVEPPARTARDIARELADRPNIHVTQNIRNNPGIAVGHADSIHVSNAPRPTLTLTDKEIFKLDTEHFAHAAYYTQPGGDSEDPSKFDKGYLTRVRLNIQTAYVIPRARLYIRAGTMVALERLQQSPPIQLQAIGDEPGCVYADFANVSGTIDIGVITTHPDNVQIELKN